MIWDFFGRDDGILESSGIPDVVSTEIRKQGGAPHQL